VRKWRWVISLLSSAGQDCRALSFLRPGSSHPSLTALGLALGAHRGPQLELTGVRLLHPDIVSSCLVATLLLARHEYLPKVVSTFYDGYRPNLFNANGIEGRTGRRTRDRCAGDRRSTSRRECRSTTVARQRNPRTPGGRRCRQNRRGPAGSGRPGRGRRRHGQPAAARWTPSSRCSTTAFHSNDTEPLSVEARQDPTGRHSPR
jgi:hypothetical protein